MEKVNTASPIDANDVTYIETYTEHKHWFLWVVNLVKENKAE